MGSLVLTGNTSGSVTVAVPDVAGSNTATIGAATGTHYPFTQATAVASTSGTSIDFTGIPSWVKRITIMVQGVSTSGTSNFLIQIGSGSVTNTGYVSTAYTTAGAASSTAGFIATQTITAATTQTGLITLTLIGSNTWIAAASLGFSNTSVGNTGNGQVTLSGTLDRVRITTVNGTDTFDAGSINILYE